MASSSPTSPPYDTCRLTGSACPGRGERGEVGERGRSSSSMLPGDVNSGSASAAAWSSGLMSFVTRSVRRTCSTLLSMSTDASFEPASRSTAGMSRNFASRSSANTELSTPPSPGPDGLSSASVPSSRSVERALAWSKLLPPSSADSAARSQIFAATRSVFAVAGTGNAALLSCKSSSQSASVADWRAAARLKLTVCPSSCAMTWTTSSSPAILFRQRTGPRRPRMQAPTSGSHANFPCVNDAVLVDTRSVSRPTSKSRLNPG